jgi:hypothetical protein
MWADDGAIDILHDRSGHQLRLADFSIGIWPVFTGQFTNLVPELPTHILHILHLLHVLHRGGAWFAERSQAREVNPLECTELAPAV